MAISNRNHPEEPTGANDPVADHRSAEIAALAALDSFEAEERALVERDGDPVTLGHFHSVTAVLADAVSEVPPDDLRGHVLRFACTRRTPGRPVDPVEPSAPGDAFRRTVDELHGLLVGLRADEWSMPALESYGDIRGLVAHLTGVEENLLGVLGYGPAPDPVVYNDHVRATSSFVETLRSAPTHVLVERWHDSATRLAGAAQEVGLEAPDRVFAVNDLPATAHGMLVLRTFEVWTHHEDICRATRRVLPTLDEPRLRTMSSELISALPVAFMMRGTSRPDRTTRVVLSGNGGGVFDVPMALGSPVGPPDALIVADVVEFCRLAADRVSATDLTAVVEGDSELAALVLAAAAAFARD